MKCLSREIILSYSKFTNINSSLSAIPLFFCDGIRRDLPSRQCDLRPCLVRYDLRTINLPRPPDPPLHRMSSFILFLFNLFPIMSEGRIFLHHIKLTLSCNHGFKRIRPNDQQFYGPSLLLVRLRRGPRLVCIWIYRSFEPRWVCVHLQPDLRL